MPGSMRKQKMGWYGWMLGRLSNRPDSEHELTLSRLALSLIAFLALFIGFLSGSEEHKRFLEQISVYFMAFTGSTLFLFGHLLWKPGISEFRRLLGIPIDICGVAYLMHSGDEITAFTYPIFLWAIFGNGFRFGVKYLSIASIFGFFAFLAVVVTTPFWRDNRELSGGLLAGLVILPVYVSMLIRRLSEAKRQAEEASRAKSLFLASISHELRTPLNAVIGLSDMLGGTKLARDQAEMARTIGKSGRSLLGLINSLLDLSRMEIGNKPQMGVFDLHQLLHDIHAMLNVQARGRQIDLALHMDPDLPPKIIGSMRHFEEVLINLAGNAIKFTTHGYVLIEARVLSRSDETMRLRIEVTDTGIGIAPEAQARIFESFTQADETIIDRFGGTGLGLSIARQLVNAHGGEIGVDSMPGRGSTFWFEMEVGCSEEQVAPSPATYILHARDPMIVAAFASSGRAYRHFLDGAQAHAAWRETEGAVLAVEESALQADFFTGRAAPNFAGEGIAVLLSMQPRHVSREMRRRFLCCLALPLDEGSFEAVETLLPKRDVDAAAIQPVPVSRPLHILVAEDNRTNQMVLRQILEKGGHSAKMVDNGDLAIDALLQESFDLVLMDLNMPVMNGLDAAKFYSFAMLGQTPVPIIALTADATEETALKCREAGMVDCLNKPIEPQALLEVVARYAGPALAEAAPVAEPVIDAPVQDEAAADAACSDAVDPRALRDLEALGGKSFVSEIVTQFVSDAAGVLGKLGEAVHAMDVTSFRDHAHALRSCAANVGAQAIYRRCLDLRAIDAQELAKDGMVQLRALEAEFQAARGALAPHMQ